MLAANLVAGLASPTIVIRNQLTPAQVAALPTGNTLNIPSAAPKGSGPNASAPFTPAQIRHAYGVDQLPFDGAGQTIAIVDAHDNPTIAADLIQFDQKFGLAPANFVKATPQGQPSYDQGWAGEIALDVEWAHSIAPAAKILLVESLDAGQSLYDAVTYAYQQGASQISMSFGSGEYASETSLDSLFNHPGTSFFASSGDTASELSYPAASPYVTSVGGTNITLDDQANKLAESAWSSGGGGLSTVEAEPSYQVGFSTSTSGRAIPDVSYDADPDSGVVIDVNGSFFDVGGTSASSPQWAGLAALANEGRQATGKPSLGTGFTYGLNSVLYNLAGVTSYTNPNGDFFDVTTGSNGHAASTGYDLATGLGAPIAPKIIPDLIGQVKGTPPTIVTPASATPNPVTAKTAQLSVLGADATGESSLNYIWSVTSASNGATLPTFAVNNSNAAKNDVATFTSAGIYTFQVEAFNKSGLSAKSSVTVTVNSTFKSLAITPTTLQLSANGTESFSSFYSDQFGNQVGNSPQLTWTLTSGGGTLSQSGFYTAPPVGTIATVTASAGAYRASATIYVLSNPWTQTDIGGPSLAGDAADNGTGQFTLLGSGTGLAGTSDQLQFAYLTLTGSSTIQAQVASEQNTNIAAQAGLNYRTDTTAGSPYVGLVITPGQGLVFSTRALAGGLITRTAIPGVIPGDYLRIVRVGNVFTAAYSLNGTNWSQAGVANLALGASALGGLVVSSGNTSALNTTTFSHVLADANPFVSVTAMANPSPVTTTTTTLTALGGDAAGEGALSYTWSTTAFPTGAVAPSFATNGTNASKKDVVTFSKAGNYTFQVTMTNALGYSVTSSVSVSVIPTRTTVVLTPQSATVQEGATLQFFAGVFDQFGQKLGSQPMFTFSMVAGGAGGRVSSVGLYTAPNNTGIDYLNVTGAGTAAVAKITVVRAPSPALAIQGNSNNNSGGGSMTAPPLAPSYLLSTFTGTDLPAEAKVMAKGSKSIQLLNGTTVPTPR